MIQSLKSLILIPSLGKRIGGDVAGARVSTSTDNSASTNTGAQCISKKELGHPGCRPGGSNSSDDHVLVKPFWLKAGQIERVDFAEVNRGNCSRLCSHHQCRLIYVDCHELLHAGPGPFC